MIDYEQLGLFYLGRESGKAEPLLLQSRHLTTHAVVLGMTGSGKTGLSIGLLEEAALDGIPVLAIDPKGDLGNLALTFPELRGADFQAWVDPEESRRKQVSVEALGEATATTWRQGLAGWGQGPDRIARLKAAADVRIYTPGSRAGVPLAMLRSFAAPGADADEDGVRERIVSTAGGLLSLLGIDADPLQSREHVLVSRILQEAWASGRSLDLAGLIHAIQKPPFERIGVLDIESFYPSKDRAGLALALNNLLASPGAAAWLEGEPLDIGRLLYTPEGKPRIAIVSIAHLGDAERMFVVSSLLAELVGWMRSQGGTSSLRALCFMDEVFGFFPPTANPPSKGPMLTLLKQARAFGLGMVLATQNPVDLDYKGLSNCGTWFLGRLQTERDKLRVLDGLEGAASGGSFDRAAMERTLSGLAPRHFVLHSVYANGPLTFETRWTLSYLRGPITREEIKRLTVKPATTPATKPTPSGPGSATATLSRPAPAELAECFVGASGRYIAHVLIVSRVHYVDAKLKIDAWEDVTLAAPWTPDGPDWGAAWPVDRAVVTHDAVAGVAFEPPPAPAMRKGASADLSKRYIAWVYQSRAARLPRSPLTGTIARFGEDPGAFRSRAAQAAREARDVELSVLQAKMAPRIAAQAERVRKAQARLSKEEADAAAANLDTVATWGGAIFGAFFGRGSAVSKVTQAARTTNRNLGAHDDVSAAQESLSEAVSAQRMLASELEERLRQVGGRYASDTLQFDTVEVRARKADTDVRSVALLWVARPE
ncbi:ATP-binding protein [Deltaproteobacteria bacterium]|nr:ATP-binding protein [Deltaproteobacteria bacterium]